MLQRMLNRLRGVNDDEKGFTLIELLVVILIIGILAAIALPTFLGQQKKAQDASAKSDVRNAVTQVESCLADSVKGTSDVACGKKGASPAGNDGLVPLKTVAIDSKASLGASGGPSYTILASSKSGHTFTITRTDGGLAQYTSSPPDAKWDDNTK